MNFSTHSIDQTRACPTAATGISRPRLLVVDDDETLRKLLQEVFQREGYSVALASSSEAALLTMRSEVFPLVLSDIRMLELDGLALLRAVKRQDASSVVILMTGFGSMEGALDAIREGAFDYVSKPFQLSEIKTVVHRAEQHWEGLQRARQLGQDTRSSSQQLAWEASQRLIGKSPQIVEIYKTLARATLSNATVLISGEPGSGKERVARAIHLNSSRHSAPWVVWSPRESSAEERWAQAKNGTLLIDEVADLSDSQQLALLRHLEEDGGEPDAPRAVRVVAVTRHDLEARVAVGKFREDLLYRLKVIAIEIPPLRDRLEDLPLLVEAFVARYSVKNQKAISHVSPEALELLLHHDWPGNVRELENAIERAVALSRTTVLYPEDFPPEVRPDFQKELEEPAAPSPLTSLEELERAHITQVLKQVGYNKSKASEVLGIDRATLYRRAQRYGIQLRGR